MWDRHHLLDSFLDMELFLSIVVSLIISGVILGLMNAMGHAKINWFQACQMLE